MEICARRLDGPAWRGYTVEEQTTTYRDSRWQNTREITTFDDSIRTTKIMSFNTKKEFMTMYNITKNFSIVRNFCETLRYNFCEILRYESLKQKIESTKSLITKTCGFNAAWRRRNIGAIFTTKMSTFILFLCLILQNSRQTDAAFTTVSTVPDPEFVDEIGNITVPAGRNVKLTCSVNNLGTYKVAWMLFDKSAILTVQNHVITRNPRISVSHDKHRTWVLHINNVQEDDKGKYMCQINTATAKTHYGYLHVVVPPDIDDSLSSSDAIVRENANVTLTCKATGSPTPSIKWKRDDNELIAINKTLEVAEWEGETLEMTRISRLGMGAYLCIASNGIPPTVSKQIKVSVDFSPMLSIPHQLVGAPLGYTVTLECHTEAHPTSLNYWTRDDNGPMIHDGKKYTTTVTPEKPSYKTHMTLTIKDIEESDYGSYKCVAKNPRGSTDGTIRLYPWWGKLRGGEESTPPSTIPSPVTTDLSHKGWDVLAEMNNSVDGNPSSLTFHDKGTKQGKSGSHLNEIDKSEQKSDLDRKRNYNWPEESDAATRFSTTGILPILAIISSWIIR